LLWRCEAAWGAAGPFYRWGKAVRPGISRAREASTMAVEVGNILSLTPSSKAVAGICCVMGLVVQVFAEGGGRRGGVSGEHAFNGGRRLPGRGSGGAPAGGAAGGVLRRPGAGQGEVWGRRCWPGTRRRSEGEVNGARRGRLREEEGEGRKREGKMKGKRKKRK
jgi:hypothetical protein